MNNRVVNQFNAVVHDEISYQDLLLIKPITRELMVLKYWGEMADDEFFGASLEEQKIIICKLIERVSVRKWYQIEIELNSSEKSVQLIK